MATETLRPQTLTAILNYHLEPARGGAEVWCPGTVRDKSRPHKHQECIITNIRGHEEEFTLDKQGFHVGPFRNSAPNMDENEIKGRYHQDMAAHVEITGATKVVPVVHIARRLRWEEGAEAEKSLSDDEPVTAPTANCFDQSYFGAELIRDSKLEEFPVVEAEKLKKSRWAIVNLWRPFDLVARDNMALCDARTAEESDLVPVYANISEKPRNAKTEYNCSAKSRSEA